MERKPKELKHWFRNRHKSRSHIQLAQYDLQEEMQGPDEAVMRKLAYISH